MGLGTRADALPRRARWHILAFAAVVAVLAAPLASPSAAGVSEGTLLKTKWEDATSLRNYDADEYEGSTHWVSQGVIGAGEFWEEGFIGTGIDIALIDSGIAPVDGLTSPGKVINGPDLSFESQAENLRYLDTYGHGTHLAGIIAGRDGGSTKTKADADRPFLGVAPGARLVSIKVADAVGATDVSQVIAAIEWVVDHRRDNGMNIRVLNLSYGTDGRQDYRVDPLAHAVEKAWNAGIVVVVAAGNDGNGALLRNPAVAPFVIAVGASESNETFAGNDDRVATFSNCGNSARHVDVVAPGKSIVSLRAPGSYADQTAPKARVGERFFLGSGTSQAAAVVSGAVALILDQRPDLSPDQVKALLMESAEEIDDASERCQGAGLIDLEGALGEDTPKTGQKYTATNGKGSLENSRGSNHVYDGDVALVGEIDIMGNPWKSPFWEKGFFNGAVWTGDSWTAKSWSGSSWSGASWSGASWSGASWSSKIWSGASWSGGSWSGGSWSGGSWSGGSWSGDAWQGLSWRGPAAML